MPNVSETNGMVTTWGAIHHRSFLGFARIHFELYSCQAEFKLSHVHGHFNAKFGIEIPFKERLLPLKAPRTFVSFHLLPQVLSIGAGAPPALEPSKSALKCPLWGLH